jgi:GTPase SAR1 family protein
MDAGGYQDDEDFLHEVTCNSLIRIAVIGECGVGKTSMIRSLTKADYLDNTVLYIPTVGCDISVHSFTLPKTNSSNSNSNSNGETLFVEFWDIGELVNLFLSLCG